MLIPDIEIYSDGSMTKKKNRLYLFCFYEIYVLILRDKILQFLQKVKRIFQNLFFQTELLEIEEEIHCVHNSLHTEFLIFTDSLSRFQALEISESSNYLIIGILKFLQNSR